MNARLTVVLISAAVLGACAGRQVRQPRMQHALELLQGAVVSLENATSDKGGHRVKAISEVRSAIDEVNAGIQFDDTH